MDEPLSTLDPRAEYELNKNIMEQVRDADCIYMFESGEIIERGTHQELMALNGQYTEMFRCQARYYQDIVLK